MPKLIQISISEIPNIKRDIALDKVICPRCNQPLLNDSGIFLRLCPAHEYQLEKQINHYYVQKQVAAFKEFCQRMGIPPQKQFSIQFFLKEGGWNYD